jgi:hypothetical protein
LRDILLNRKFCAWTLLVLASGCGTVQDCGQVLGEDVPRIRSTALRMKLADHVAAAGRFAPYAAMSALAYVEEGACKDKNDLEHQPELERYVSGLGWRRVPEIEKAGDCEDDVGLYYQVWRREVSDAVEVVVVFRGTRELKDWYYGNMRWFTRVFTSDDQYNRARRYSREVLEHFKSGDGRRKQLRFAAAGHSLGGGLAQAVLYDQPHAYVQAYAFSSSPVTGYMDQPIENRMAGCSCNSQLGTEARIYRFYESDEILSHLRFVVKLFLSPDRHIHEVRFGFADGNIISQHSMPSLAKQLITVSEGPPISTKWYEGIGEKCTEKFESRQRESCELVASRDDACPSL